MRRLLAYLPIQSATYCCLSQLSTLRVHTHILYPSVCGSERADTMQVATGTKSLRCGAQSRCGQQQFLPQLPTPRIRSPSCETRSCLRSQHNLQQQRYAAYQRQTVCRTQAQETTQLETSATELVGEDAAAFDLSKQSLQSWGIFGVLLTTVLGAMYLVSYSTGYSSSSMVLLPASSACMIPALIDQRLQTHQQ